MHFLPEAPAKPFTVFEESLKGGEFSDKSRQKIPKDIENFPFLCYSRVFIVVSLPSCGRKLVRKRCESAVKNQKTIENKGVLQYMKLGIVG